MASINGGTDAHARILHENESARVENRSRDRGGRDLVIVLGPPAEPANFVRAIPKRTIRALDLVDVVAGGDGFSGRRNAGIDPNSGRIISVLPGGMAGASLWEEIEAASVTAPNLLQGKTATASSSYTGGPGVEGVFVRRTPSTGLKATLRTVDRLGVRVRRSGIRGWP